MAGCSRSRASATATRTSNVIAADGTGQRRLTNDPAAETRPTWSADGSTIVFTRSDGSGRRLVAMNVSGGATRELTAPSQSADTPSWQPGVDLALSAGRVGRPRRGQPARVRIVVRNQLLSPAFFVSLRISIPRSARLVAVRGGRCRRARLLSCSIRELRSSATLSVELILRQLRCGSVTVGSSVSSLQRDVQLGNNRRRTRLAVAC
jgi:hypothetical protein